MQSSGLAIVMMKDLTVNLCTVVVVVRIHYEGEMPLVGTNIALAVLDSHLM